MDEKQFEHTIGSKADAEHILVCLSAAPSNAKIIRTAAQMARAFQASFSALFVETPEFSSASEADKRRLKANSELARSLGASLERVCGDDISFQIAEFARLSGVSKIVIGRSSITGKRLFWKMALTDKLIMYAPNVEIYIIPDGMADVSYRLRRERTGKGRLSGEDGVKSILSLTASTLLSLLFYRGGFSNANIITVYILGVLITAAATEHMIYSFLASVASVIIFNYFFTDPRYTLLAYDKEYPVTFLIMFVAALLTGTLAVRMKNLARQSAQHAYRTKILLDTNQLLSVAGSREEVIRATANQLFKLLRRDIAIYLEQEGQISQPQILSELQEPEKESIFKREMEVARWALENNEHTGATSEHFPRAGGMYFSIRSGQAVYGVVGIDVRNHPVDAFENSILLSILGECAMALENEKNAREKEAAAILAKNEQLRANLLRTISHDLRTPLTSISGNASNLLTSSGDFDEETKRRLYGDIYNDSMWLINLVENLLAVSRMEGQGIHIRTSIELMDEVIGEALRHLDRRSVEHEIIVHSTQDIILAKIDAKLIVQVIINIVNNAIEYTQKGSRIELSMEKRGRMVAVDIADNGPGIPDEVKPRVFEMFYSGANLVTDGHRSMGLGLALCKSIITAHGGTISVSDQEPCGTVFCFTVPVGEVQLHE